MGKIKGGWVAMVICLAALGAGTLLLWMYFRPPAPPDTASRLFQDVAAESGITFKMNFLPGEQGEKFKINLYDHGAGVSLGDYDGDGYEDIYFCNQLGQNALYRNKGDGTFEDKAGEAGVALGDRICVSSVFVDYDNDGRQDLFVTSTRGGNVLFHNEGRGRFQDVTKSAGLSHVGHSNSAHFFDYDNDGHLDLFLTNTAKWTLAALESKLKYYPGKVTYFDTAGSEKELNLLYRNNGNGTFTDVSAKSGLQGLGWAADAAIFDFNDDNLPDVLVTNMFGRAQLYKNLGKKGFAEVTKEVLGKTSWGGMGAQVFDFNNDGKLDLYIVDMHSDMWLPFEADLAAIDPRKRFRHLGIPLEENHPQVANMLKASRKFTDLVHLNDDEVLYGNTFFKNLGDGKFVEMSGQANLETFWPWGIASGDFDNDGREDVFIPAGMGYPFAYWPNSLMMNAGNEAFIDNAIAFGIEPPTNGIHQEELIGGKPATTSSRSAAVADFNKDGRLDIVCNNFNARAYYFKNIGKKSNYLTLRLTGTKSNRDAVGAVVRLHTEKEILTRQVNSAGGYLAQSSRLLHFGLGARSKIDRIEISWPSGRRQTVSVPTLNTFHEVTEPKEGV